MFTINQTLNRFFEHCPKSCLHLTRLKKEFYKHLQMHLSVLNIVRNPLCRRLVPKLHPSPH